MVCIFYTAKLAFPYNSAIEIQIQFSNNCKNELSTGLENKQNQMHVTNLPCCYNRRTCSNMKTVFHILYMSCGTRLTDVPIKGCDAQACSKQKEMDSVTDD